MVVVEGQTLTHYMIISSFSCYMRVKLIRVELENIRGGRRWDAKAETFEFL
jgi:hypothetical protein